jgi:hypothetical protein
VVVPAVAVAAGGGGGGRRSVVRHLTQVGPEDRDSELPAWYADGDDLVTFADMSWSFTTGAS